MFAKFCLELICLMYADAAPQGFAFLEYNQCGHRLYTIALGNSQILVYIYFKDIRRITHAVFYILDDRRLHLAGAAPCRKKVNKSRFFFIYKLIEIVHSVFLFYVVSMFLYKFKHFISLKVHSARYVISAIL